MTEYLNISQMKKGKRSGDIYGHDSLDGNQKGD